MVRKVLIIISLVAIVNNFTACSDNTQELNSEIKKNMILKENDNQQLRSDLAELKDINEALVDESKKLNNILLQKTDEIYDLTRIIEAYKEGAVDRATLNTYRKEIEILKEMIIQYDKYLTENNENSNNNDTITKNNLYLGMSLSEAKQRCEESAELELIPHFDGTYLVRKEYGFTHIDFNPIKAINIRTDSYTLENGNKIFVEQNFDEAITLCKSLYLNVDTPNGGILENWFYLNDEELLIIGNEDNDHSLESKTVQYIELTRADLYN